MRKVLTVVGVAACLWIASPDAQAAPILRLSQTGFADLVIADNTAGDENAAAGAIAVFLENYGDFQLTFLGGTSNAPGVVDANLEIGTFFAVNTSNATKTLNVSFTDTGFMAPGDPGDLIPVVSSVGSASVMAGSQVTFTSYVDPGNIAFGNALALAPVVCSPGPSCSSDVVLYFNRPAQYSLTNVTNLQVAAGQSVSFDGLTTSAVPEPGSMLLFGTGLMGLAGAARRRLRNRGSQQ